MAIAKIAFSHGMEAAAGTKTARPYRRKNTIMSHVEILEGIFIAHSPLLEMVLDAVDSDILYFKKTPRTEIGCGVCSLMGQVVELTLIDVILENHAAVPNDRACAVERLDGTQGYDAERYGELLLRAVESLLTPAGITGEMLGEWIKKELPTPALHARLKELQERVYWGPLFEFAGLEARMKVRVAA